MNKIGNQRDFTEVNKKMRLLLSVNPVLMTFSVSGFRSYRIKHDVNNNKEHGYSVINTSTSSKEHDDDHL